MMTWPSRKFAVLLACSTLMTVALTGCDYWPPALQAQIEQLRTESQTAAADKALLQNQLNAANKAKEELQARVEDLTRVNKEKSGMIANLERSLATERERAAKMTKTNPAKGKPKPAPAVKPLPKLAPKVVPKTQPKKKTSQAYPKRVA
jgi:septal ring factor EnvC (AmiA/AmiB activator)